MNTPIFTDLTIDENIYLLGFLWADGNLYKTTIEIALVKDDFDYIKPILEKLGIKKFEIRQRTRNNRSFGKLQCRFRITNKNIANFLLSVDFDKKSFIAPTKILSMIPDDKKYLWWRGYIDGDGCFYCRGITRNFSIWSTINQDWLEFNNLCKFLSITDPTITKYIRKGGKHCSSKISLTSKENIKKLGLYLYSNQQSIGFKRKYEKYLLCISKPKPLFKKIKSNVKGVYYSVWCGKWIVRKTINGKRITIGSYSNYNDACNALMMSTI